MRSLDTLPVVGSASPRAARAQLSGSHWLLPDMAMVGAIATLLCVFAGSGGPSGLLRDSDTGWHIVSGERILRSHTLPVADVFSFSKPGQPWISWEWGADVFIALIHRAAGLGGVAAISGLVIATAVWMWFRLTWAVEGNFVIAALLAAPAMAATSLHWLARPHVFGWLFLIAAVWHCERSKERRAIQYLAIALLSALWANFHASFFLGPVVALTYAAGTFVGNAVWGQERNVSRHLLAAAAATMGTFINPRGWQLHAHVYSYLTDSKLLDRIGEFQSFNFHNTGAASVTIALIAAVGGGFAALTVRRPERFLLSLLLTAAALRSARAIPLAALVLLPLANGTFTEILSLARGLAPALRRKLDDALRYGDSLRRIDRMFAGWAVIPVAAALVFIGVGSRTAFPQTQFPITSADAVAQLPQDARLLSTDKFGGYLIYRFAGTRKVFFDGRSDFYGADFIERYARMIEARPGWQQEFASWHFTHALLPPDTPLLSALEAAGWRELHRDRTAVLVGTGKV